MTPSDALPLVSVVIPSYNYDRYVTAAVDSALAQTYPAVEVIVVDDGSTDDTRDRLAVYGDRIRYIHQENQGLSAARNTGIKAARGEYVALLDSDDMFHPRKVELQMGEFVRRPELGLVATDHFSDDPPAWLQPVPAPTPVTDLGLEEIVLRSRFSPSSAVVRRECFNSVGLFDTSLRSVEDREMWIRIAARYRVAVVDLPLTWYRITPGSMSSNPERMEKYEWLVLDRAFSMPELARQRILRRKAFGLACSSSAYVYYTAFRPTTAVRRLLRSVLWWPIPYWKPDVHQPFVRARLLLASLRRLLA